MRRISWALFLATALTIGACGDDAADAVGGSGGATTSAGGSGGATTSAGGSGGAATNAGGSDPGNLWDQGLWDQSVWGP